MDRTPEEQRVLDEIAAQTAAGADPFGDDEELVRPGAGGELPADEPSASTNEADDANDDTPADTTAATEEPAQGQTDKAAGEGATKEDLDPAVLADIADPLQLNQAPVQFVPKAPENYKEQRTKLLSDKAAATAKLMNGEIDTEQYAAEEVRIAEALDELTRQQVRAETLAEVNQQNTEQYSDRVLKALIKRTKDEIDYKADPDAAQAFDDSMQLLLRRPANANKDIAEVYEDAHKMVAAMKGIELKQKQPTGDATQQAGKTGEVPNRKPDVTMPVTLRNVPAAAQPNTGGGVEEQLSRLHGPEFEAAFEKLSPAQRARMLDED